MRGLPSDEAMKSCGITILSVESFQEECEFPWMGSS